MAKFIPVEPEKWAEMVKAAAASDYWRIEAETDHARWLRTLEENEKLRAEVERLTFDPMTYLDDQGEWMPRHIHLAAVERLKAEVERLRKAGDELLHEWSSGDETDGRNFKKGLVLWNAAKEGKQS